MKGPTVFLAVVCVLNVRWGGEAQGQDVFAPSRVENLRWDGVPLGEAVERLSTTISERMFLDRRIDPRQRVRLQVTDATFDDVLREIGTAASLGVSRLARVAYLGPPDAARHLRTLAALRAEEAVNLPASLRAAIRQERKLDWPRLSEPRQLVARLAEEGGWNIAGAERIPHDLWAAADLGEMSLVDGLTLLLVGFDLTFHWNAARREIEIVPITGPVTLRRRYKLPQPGDAETLRLMFPQATFAATGREIVLDAIVEEHERLEQMLFGGPAPVPRQPSRMKMRQVYSLRVEEQPVGAVLAELGKRLGWQIEIDETGIAAAGHSLEQRVSFSVRNASADELLAALLRPAGLGFEREGEKVRVFAE